MNNAAIWFSTVLLLGGLTTTSSSVVGAKPAAPELISQHSVDATSVTPSIYASIKPFKKNNSANKIIWKGGSITLTATTVKLEGKPTFEQNVIQSIVVTKGSQKHTIETSDLEDNWLDISSVVASNSNTWLAINAKRSAGNTLMLLNLQTGEVTELNDRLKKAGKKNIETIATYNWAPHEDQIAFSYGDPSKSSLAIYNVQKESLIYLPRATNYISTNLILWQKNGKTLDYISEYPSDQMILYRYSLESNKVKPVKKISRNEFAEWFKLDKYPTQ
ncbi:MULTISPECIES: hypothetical protein [unclassified Paenibacillus]|uniref:hypothetical protein n=1 Tax=unclassified Paenibacillus TaxID=185978 RepID=UPI0004137DF3|nr:MULTISPECIES: hypothetical protein [unclassified Paenibacillus]KGP80064.1 hypothetical protein P364_0121905 [Paenibacillus sp. MAEPY2]KGP89435.1 hypothetical protein P363_0100385 [Paenibacillus sp. MAEPY1]